MRVNLKGLLLLIVIGSFFTLMSYWTRCGQHLEAKNPFPEAVHTHFQTKFSLQELHKDDSYVEDSVYGNAVNGPTRHDFNTNTLEEIECLINGEYPISCRREGQEVYVPFSFLHKYFEVYGKVVLSSAGGYERFEWQHSSSKFYYPQGVYDPSGPFMHFKNYHVEARERVKCVSATDGVPVSTQWDARGYYYPIQISQYGLSHYSKNITEPKPKSVIYEDGEIHRGLWQARDKSARTSYKRDKPANSRVMVFSTDESLESGVELKLDENADFILSLDFRFNNNGSLSISLEDKDRREKYFIHYVCSTQMMSIDGNHVFYGMGSWRSQWGHITRDISIDFKKGFSGGKSSKRPKLHFSKIKILNLVMRGSGAVDNVTMSSSAHVAHFFDASNWLLRNQDENGGWPIFVERRFNTLGMSNLQPGWYSAMAQGQAMSLLTRAYRSTGELKYLSSALQALGLFKIASQEHGVMTKFLEKYVWYEEYPTIPSSFVLNGFIYALLGLYDVKEGCIYEEKNRRDQANLLPACSEQKLEEVTGLYNDGMHSLKKMLPLFDSGSSSIYDLRHFTLGVAPNLARWDYHTTHIDQLLLLATIDDDPILKTTAERWIEYMKGKRAAHN
uniref:heparosan-N-sulfate-glucuronate 5-epimerase n=1 Tax=Strigamia maritima TaxID=126957 RepID=T1JNE4_STRMM